MKLTNDEQTKRSLIRTQKRVLDLEERVALLEKSFLPLLRRAFAEVHKAKLERVKP